MSGKNLPPPSGGDDLEALLRRRRTPPEEAVAPVAPVAPPEEKAKPQAQGSGMDRRSWYMPKSSADALAAAVEDLHFDTRRPKHEVLRALVEVALEHRGEAVARLKGE
ncbi:hypothetical protein ACFZBZ_45795 [Streptomyces sp. NPDC008196]|uniref:hypothetical protein n=1 Tax=Streptomyces sp. NPDC008196 TaxID=3364819 RepID=UPI0036E9A809